MVGGLVLLLVLAALLPSSLAMTCDSNTEATKCNSAVDGNVKCVWDETKGTCGSGDERTETGMVGITSVEVENPNPMDDMPIPTLTPEEVQKAVDALSLTSTFCTLPPDNTTSTGPSPTPTRAFWPSVAHPLPHALAHILQVSPALRISKCGRTMQRAVSVGFVVVGLTD